MRVDGNGWRSVEFGGFGGGFDERRGSLGNVGRMSTYLDFGRVVEDASFVSIESCARPSNGDFVSRGEPAVVLRESRLGLNQEDDLILNSLFLCR